MLIEFCGIPASGKSTLIQGLLGAGKCNGWTFTRAVASAPSAVKMPRYVTRHPDRRQLYQAARFRAAHGAFFAEADRLCGGVALDLFFFLLTAQSYQDWHDAPVRGAAVLFDEGLAGRAAALSASRKQDAEPLARLAPLPSVLVMVDTPPEIAFDRATHRHGPSEKMRDAVISLHGDEAMFTRRRTAMVETCAILEARGTPVVRVDAAKSAGEAVGQAMSELGQILPVQ
ncbi:MAG: hypothetical protein HKP35_02440 [Silicimonas sp.]|nr:hypothetical protein [Silicimonas sp.]